jgi:hypothetical protein
MRLDPDPEGALRLVLGRTVEGFQTQPFVALQHKDGWSEVQGKTCGRLEHVLKNPADQQLCQGSQVQSGIPAAQRTHRTCLTMNVAGLMPAPI